MRGLQEVFGPDHRKLGSPAQTELRGALLVRQLERKEEMRAYPSDVEYFVQRTTSMKDWPVFNHEGGSIALDVFGTAGRTKTLRGLEAARMGEN